MDASKARAISDAAKTGPAMQPYLDAVLKEILKAAEQGLRSWYFQMPRFRDGIGLQQKQAIETAVLDQLRTLHYEVTYHAGDQRDPRETAYYLIGW